MGGVCGCTNPSDAAAVPQTVVASQQPKREVSTVEETTVVTHEAASSQERGNDAGTIQSDTTTTNEPDATTSGDSTETPAEDKPMADCTEKGVGEAAGVGGDDASSKKSRRSVRYEGSAEADSEAWHLADSQEAPGIVQIHCVLLAKEGTEFDASAFADAFQAALDLKGVESVAVLEQRPSLLNGLELYTTLEAKGPGVGLCRIRVEDMEDSEVGGATITKVRSIENISA